MTEKREEKKRALVNGFDRETMPKKLASLNKYGATWRKVGSETVVMTVLHQIFTHTSGEETVIKHLCPWGMREIVGKFLSEKRCLPLQLKEDHPMLTGDSYNKLEWMVTISNEGALKAEKYHHLYCHHCKQVLLPKLLEEYADGLGGSKSLVGLVNNWDALKIPAKYLDYIGCFLPWSGDINAGPNARRFIRDQS